MKKFTLFLFTVILFMACTRDQLTNPIDLELQRLLSNRSYNGDYKHYVLPDSDDLANIPQGVGNPLTPEKVALGKMLFFETGLAQDAIYESGRGTYSCATCHVPSAGFMPGRIQGIADGGVGFGYNGEARTKLSEYEESELDVQGARPLSMLNVAYVSNSTWAGRFGAHGVNEGTEELWHDDGPAEINFLGYDGLESQNIEGLELHRMVIDKPLMDELGYTSMFDEAFPDFAEEDRYSKTTASFAISAYLRTLLPTEAPFQKWLKGERNAMTEREKEGALLFYGKAGCYRCHKGPALSAVEFHAIGVRDLYENGEAFNTSIDDARNLGRGDFTRKAEDMYKFKVPQLYNMADSPFYFHGSSKRTLWGVVQYFNEGVPENPNVPKENISSLFHPLNLTDNEVEAVVNFLEKSLRDPDLQRYVPEEVLSGNCFPNNDPKSREDMGCQ